MKFVIPAIAFFSFVSLYCNPAKEKVNDKDIFHAAIIAEISERITKSGEKAEINKVEINEISQVGHGRILQHIIDLYEINVKDVAALLVDAFKRARANPKLSGELAAWESGKLKDEELVNVQLQKLAALKKLHDTWLKWLAVKQRSMAVADTAKKYFAVRSWVVLQNGNGEVEEFYPTFFFTNDHKRINPEDSVPKLHLESFE